MRDLAETEKDNSLHDLVQTREMTFEQIELTGKVSGKKRRKCIDDKAPPACACGASAS